MEEVGFSHDAGSDSETIDADIEFRMGCRQVYFFEKSAPVCWILRAGDNAEWQMMNQLYGAAIVR